MLRRLAGWEAFSAVPPLVIHQTSSGKWLTIDADPPEFIATLSGSGPAYSWSATELSRTGSANAYPLNNETGLAGQKAWLRRSAAGDYRFQLNRFGWCHRTYCVVVTGLSDDAPVEGATVEILDSGFAVLDTITTDETGRACITPYPATAAFIQISVETDHGTITSQRFRFAESGSCDIEVEYTVCHGLACVNVIDATEGEPLSGADVSFGVVCANDGFAPSWQGPTVITEGPTGTYCGLVWRIQPKSRTCTGSMIHAIAWKLPCYYCDATYPFQANNGDATCGVSGAFACDEGWTGEITLKHFTRKLRVGIMVDCLIGPGYPPTANQSRFTVDVAGVGSAEVALSDLGAGQTLPSGLTYYVVEFDPPWPYQDSYDVTVTPITPGYSGAQGATVAFSCWYGDDNGWAGFLFTLDEDYICGCCAKMPVKRTLYGSDAYGSAELTYDPTYPIQPAWRGSYGWTDASVRVPRLFEECQPAPDGEPATATIGIIVTCNEPTTDPPPAGFHKWRVRKLFLTCVYHDGYGNPHTAPLEGEPGSSGSSGEANAECPEAEIAFVVASFTNGIASVPPSTSPTTVTE